MATHFSMPHSLPSAADWTLPVISRSRRIVIALGMVWLLNGFDLWFTVLADTLGALFELNPFARWILPYGMGAITVYKLAALTVGTGLIWRSRHCRLAEIGTWFIVAINVGLALRWHQFYQML
jgi:hypothetical protein